MNELLIPTDTVSRMKHLNELIHQIDEMELVFGRCKETDDSYLIRKKAKLELFTLICEL